MARLLLVALLVYTALDGADPVVFGALDLDDDDVIVASSPIDPRGKLSPTITTLPRWVALVHVEGLAGSDRLATQVRPIERVPPQLRPRHVAELRPASASDDH